MRNNSGVQIKLVAESLGCRQGLVRRLTVDVQYAGEGEDKIGPFL
jgi:hypothetical protein